MGIAQIVEAAYGSKPGDAHWNPEADLNSDGCVNYIDYGIAGNMTPPDTTPTPPATPTGLRVGRGGENRIMVLIGLLFILMAINMLAGRL